MISIDVYLFVAGGFALYTIGFITASFLGGAKIGDAQQSESYWRQLYQLERDSHNGTQKRYISKIKEAEKIINDLTEENANLKDSVTAYREAL